MASTISQIRTLIKAQLATIASLANSSYDVWPSLVTPPAALVHPESGSYEFAYGGVQSMKFNIIIVVAYTTLEAAQNALDAYLDTGTPNSIRAAVEVDRTFGGQVASISVNGWDSYGTVDLNGVKYLGARLLCEVWPLS